MYIFIFCFKKIVHKRCILSLSRAILEYIFVMYRRQMLGCMIHPTSSIIAVVTMALEEAVFRSTMVQRDKFFRWMRGLPELKGAELEEMVRTDCYYKFIIIIREAWNSPQHSLLTYPTHLYSLNTATCLVRLRSYKHVH